MLNLPLYITIFSVISRPYRYIVSFDTMIRRFNFTAPLAYRYIGVPLYCKKKKKTVTYKHHLHQG